MTSKNRRETNRSPIKVLVRCLPPGTPVRRNGHLTKGWEMWAFNIADDGVGLRWSRDWSTLNCPHCVKDAGELVPQRGVCLCTPPDKTLKKNQTVTLDELVYTEKGSVPMKAKIRWIRPHQRGKFCDVGVHVTARNHRSLFRVLEDVGPMARHR